MWIVFLAAGIFILLFLKGMKSAERKKLWKFYFSIFFLLREFTLFFFVHYFFPFKFFLIFFCEFPTIYDISAWQPFSLALCGFYWLSLNVPNYGMYQDAVLPIHFPWGSSQIAAAWNFLSYFFFSIKTISNVNLKSLFLTHWGFRFALLWRAFSLFALRW